MGRRSALAFGAAIGTVLGIGLYGRLFRRGQRVDLYFEDGSMISLEGDSSDAQRLLPVARDLLSTVG